MKIRLWSDIHLEFRSFLFDHIHVAHSDDKDTTLLLAGDISLGTTAKPFVEEMCKHFKHVLMIHGNHEYYHNDFSKTIKAWQDYEMDESPKNFHYLHNDSRVLDDVRFIGGTMWTSFNEGDPLTMDAAARMMNDYACIHNNGEVISPDFIKDENQKFMTFLIEKFDEPFDGPTVVMSHHSPGNEIKRRGRRGDRLGGCYFADIEELIGWHDKAKLWVHGHTHQSWDYMVNNTRVVCNPYGYWGNATNPTFDRLITLEV